MPELDGIRGLAILFVILYHYFAVAIPKGSGLAYKVIRQILSNGWSGVDLFFVLSGFLITGILIDNREANNYYKVFYIRRITRIFPLYYFFLLIFIILSSSSNNLPVLNQELFINVLPIGSYFLYIQNFYMAIVGDFGNEFLAVTWSLAIEEQFYLLLPLLIRINKPNRFPITVLFFISIPLILRASLPTGGYFDFVLTPWRFDSLFMGAFLAVIYRSPNFLELLLRNIRYIKILFVALLVFFVYSSIVEDLGSLDHLFIFSILYGCLIFLSLAEKDSSLTKIARNRHLIFLGNISYGVYLFHQIINGLLHYGFFKQMPSIQDLPTVIVTLLSLLLTILISFISYRVFERRFINFGHRYSYENSQQ